MKVFVFYFIFALSILVFADTLIIPETHLTMSPAPASTSKVELPVVISQADIQTIGAKNFVDLLQNVSGIAMHSTNDQTSPSIGMRGFGDNGNSNMLIVLNGLPLRTTDSSVNYLDLMPMELIKTIDVLPESDSVLYGNGAVGGLIQVVTLKPTHFMAGVSLGAGSYAGNSQSVYIGNKIKKFYYLISAEKLRTDNNSQYDTLNKSNGLINLGYQGDETQTDFSYHDGYLNQAYPGTAEAPTANNFAITHYDWYMLTLTHDLQDDWKLKNHLSYQTNTTSGYLGGNFTESGHGLTVMPSLTGTLPFAKIATKTGISVTQDNYNFNMPSYPPPSNDTNKTYATYTEWTLPFKQKYALSFGANLGQQDAEANAISGTNHAFVTKQGLTYQPQQDLKLYLRRSGSYRFPNADETGEQNQLLKTQTGSSYETGFTWKNLKALLQMQAYLIDLDNEIAFAASSPSDPTDQANRNLDPTRRLGFLTHAHYQLTSLVTLYGDYNLVDPYYRSGPFEGNTIPLVSKQLANIGIGYQFEPRWQVYFASLYTSSFYAAGDDLNQDRIGGYTVFNSNLNYNYKAWQVSFKINNLLNKQYSTYTVFSPYVQSLSNYPAPGRNYWVTLNYDFT